VRPLSVTGIGIASAVGVGRAAFLRAMSDDALPTPRPIESFDAALYPGALALEVPDFDPSKYLGDKGLRTLDRLTKLLIVAARLAMHDAGFKKDGLFVQSSPEKVGIVCSNAYGSLEAITELDRVAVLEDARYINPAKFPNTVHNSAAGYASIWEDLRAVNVSVSDGNCGALDAVACAAIFLETGRAEALLVGGAEAMSEALYLAFHKLGATGETPLGEGAALLALEAPERAAARGAKVYGHVTGYGTAFLPPERESSLVHPSEEAMERAIEGALADAGVAPGDVHLVVSGLSGLAAFDDAERAAIERAVSKTVRIESPKKRLGETLGAGGAMAMASALAWLEGDVRTVLVTSMGYYGNASAVVMTRPRP
jgi:3-oxoacyl-[acyl-carrier-protein] synthase II